MQRTSKSQTKTGRAPTLWDWPLRLWHWSFAGCIAFLLYSGLLGDFALVDWHMRVGLALLGLLAFRLAWGLWGGIYARWGNYWTTPAAFMRHFRREQTEADKRKPHTSPGIALAAVVLVAAAVQVIAGLFVTDDIFTEGPLHRYASDEFARIATWIHHRLHWLILGALAVHLAAHMVYGLVLHDRTPLAMFTGAKPDHHDLPSTPHFWLRAAVTLVLAVGVVLAVVNAERWL